MHSRRQALALLAAAPLLLACEDEPTPGERLAQAARRQVGVTTGYDSTYRIIPYPNGDVSRRTGVCSDVLVRAARDAWGLDLQRLLHEDMTGAFAAYPQRWGLAAPNANIDHRRVPNLETWLTRHGARLWAGDRAHPVGAMDFPPSLRAGDILTFRGYWTGGPHIAVVSHGGRWPRIVHNHGSGAREDWLAQLWLDRAAGHFRWRP